MCRASHPPPACVTLSSLEHHAFAGYGSTVHSAPFLHTHFRVAGVPRSYETAPPPRTTIWPWAKSFCRVLRGRCLSWTRYPCTAAERGGNNLNDVKVSRAANGSGQGQNLDWTGSFFPKSPDSGQGSATREETVPQGWAGFGPQLCW